MYDHTTSSKHFFFLIKKKSHKNKNLNKMVLTIHVSYK